MTDVDVRPFPRTARLRGKIPLVVAPQRSIALLVRDGIIARVKAMPFFTGFHFRRSKAFKVQTDQIPYCGIYFINESMTPDGDADAGETRFRSVVQIGFSIMIQDNDPEASEDTLDDASQALFNGLFTDPTIYNNSKFKIQSFVRGSRRHSFGSVGLSNETPVAELQTELGCDLGTLTWDPIIPDMLESLHVTTVHPSSNDPNVQRVFSEYDDFQNDVNAGPILSIVPSAYRLSAECGSIVSTGRLATLTRRILVSAVGNYALIGKSDILTRSTVRFLSAIGNHVLTGGSVTFIRSIVRLSAVGNYVLTGKSGTLSTLRRSATGNYDLIGGSVTLPRSIVRQFAIGNYALIGRSVTLARNTVRLSAVGNHVLTGESVTLIRAVRLPSVTGNYVMTGGSMIFIPPNSPPNGFKYLFSTDNNYLLGVGSDFLLGSS